MNSNSSYPKISIVTPSFNQGNFIERTILSVKEQNYPNYEHIIIDGGSTDNTIEILKKYKHLKWISEKDSGQSDAVNKGFIMANGEIIGWLNADDLYFDRCLWVVAEKFLHNNEISIIYGACNYIDEFDKIIYNYNPPQYNYKNLINFGYSYIPQMSTFFKKEILDTIGYLNVNLIYSMDHDFFIRVGKNYSFYKIEETLACFRKHSSSKTDRHALLMRKESYKISKMYGGSLLLLSLNYFFSFIFYKIHSLRNIYRTIKYN